MNEILGGGYEARVKDDYTKNNMQKRFLIRKTEKHIMSEKQDNYRRPEYSPEKNVWLFNYCEDDSRHLWRKKLYEQALEAGEDPTSSYKRIFGVENFEEIKQLYNEVTAAGKPRMGDKPGKLRRPQDINEEQMLQKVGDWVGTENDPTRRGLIDGGEHGQSRSSVEGSGGPDGGRESSEGHVAIAGEVELMNKKRPGTAQPKTQQEKNIQKRIDELKSTTRWLPDSAFTTYFGKPAFHAYGHGNTKPTVGGSVYGDYLKTHNVNPESGMNNPQYKQVYGRAVISATAPLKGSPKGSHEKSTITRVPHLPRKVRDDIRLKPHELEELKARNPIMPPSYKDKGLLNIQKPDLKE